MNLLEYIEEQSVDELWGIIDLIKNKIKEKVEAQNANKNGG